MPKVNIPRSEIEAPPLAAGTYPARIDKVKQRSSQAGNDVMNIVWTIMGTDPPAGAKVLDSITLIASAFWKLDALFKGVGYVPGEDGFMTEDLVGKECQIVVVEEEYEGRPRAKVNGYIPL